MLACLLCFCYPCVQKNTACARFCFARLQLVRIVWCVKKNNSKNLCSVCACAGLYVCVLCGIYVLGCLFFPRTRGVTANISVLCRRSVDDATVSRYGGGEDADPSPRLLRFNNRNARSDARARVGNRGLWRKSGTPTVLFLLVFLVSRIRARQSA
jgi:hypothetical protein